MCTSSTARCRTWCARPRRWSSRPIRHKERFMFAYYFKLGVRSLRRNPALTALMVLTLAVGVAASVATLTILHVMSGDPIPDKSSRLFVPLFDNGPLKGYKPGEEPGDDQLSYRDATN